MKTIEYLFPDAGYLYGDVGHLFLFDQLFETHRVVRTPLSATPLFAKEDVDLIYLGAMTERYQRDVITKLMPHRERLWELIEGGAHLLLTHNAMDNVGQTINYRGEPYEALGLFDFTVDVQRWPRINQFILGDFDGLGVTAHKSQFTTTVFGPEMEGKHFFTTLKGMGANPKDKREGIHYKNVYATQCMGPFFVINPPVMKLILREMGLPEDLPAEASGTAAYETRLAEFGRPRCRQLMEV